MKGRRDAIMSGGAPRYLVVGLGNPGERYRRNRHNIGFHCVERLAREHGIALGKKRFQAVWGQGRIAGEPVVLAMPQTYMNDSGRAVAPLSRWFKIPPERIMVVYDDLDLPVGRVRLRLGGSSGGHHGLESIIAELGTGDFNRLRIGIGRPEFGDPIDYVLNDISREQEPVLAEACEMAARAIACFLERGIGEAMNLYNGVLAGAGERQGDER
jgi:PTH1 family peptidyl-tRNA hydrolase